jgi:hypothetical protein
VALLPGLARSRTGRGRTRCVAAKVYRYFDRFDTQPQAEAVRPFCRGTVPGSGPRSAARPSVRCAGQSAGHRLVLSPPRGSKPCLECRSARATESADDTILERHNTYLKEVQVAYREGFLGRIPRAAGRPDLPHRTDAEETGKTRAAHSSQGAFADRGSALRLWWPAPLSDPPGRACRPRSQDQSTVDIFVVFCFPSVGFRWPGRGLYWRQGLRPPFCVAVLRRDATRPSG